MKLFLWMFVLVVLGFFVGFGFIVFVGELFFYVLKVFVCGVFGICYDFGMILFYVMLLMLMGFFVVFVLCVGFFNIGVEG